MGHICKKYFFMITILLFSTIAFAVDLPEPDWQNSTQNIQELSDDNINNAQDFKNHQAIMLKQVQQLEECIQQAKNQDDLNFCQPVKEKSVKKQGKNSWKHNQS